MNMPTDKVAVQDEVYTFTPSNGEPEVHIWSGRLRKWLLAEQMGKLIELTFPEMTLDEMTERSGLEAPRLASMTEEEALDPVIIGIWSDGTHILIDGAHRVAFWAQRGEYTLKGWAVPEAVWRAFTFNPKDLPNAYIAPDGSLLPQRRFKGDK